MGLKFWLKYIQKLKLVRKQFQCTCLSQVKSLVLSSFKSYYCLYSVSSLNILRGRITNQNSKEIKVLEEYLQYLMEEMHVL